MFFHFYLMGSSPTIPQKEFTAMGLPAKLVKLEREQYVVEPKFRSGWDAIRAAFAAGTNIEEQVKLSQEQKQVEFIKFIMENPSFFGTVPLKGQFDAYTKAHNEKTQKQLFEFLLEYICRPTTDVKVVAIVTNVLKGALPMAGDKDKKYLERFYCDEFVSEPSILETMSRYPEAEMRFKQMVANQDAQQISADEWAVTIHEVLCQIKIGIDKASQEINGIMSAFGRNLPAAIVAPKFKDEILKKEEVTAYLETHPAIRDFIQNSGNKDFIDAIFMFFTKIYQKHGLNVLSQTLTYLTMQFEINTIYKVIANIHSTDTEKGLADILNELLAAQSSSETDDQVDADQNSSDVDNQDKLKKSDDKEELKKKAISYLKNQQLLRSNAFKAVSNPEVLAQKVAPFLINQLELNALYAVMADMYQANTQKKLTDILTELKNAAQVENEDRVVDVSLKGKVVKSLPTLMKYEGFEVKTTEEKLTRNIDPFLKTTVAKKAEPFFKTVRIRGCLGSILQEKKDRDSRHFLDAQKRSAVYRASTASMILRCIHDALSEKNTERLVGLVTGCLPGAEEIKKDQDYQEAFKFLTDADNTKAGKELLTKWIEIYNNGVPMQFPPFELNGEDVTFMVVPR